MVEEKIEKISKITKALQPEKEAIPANRDHFESLMNQRKAENITTDKVAVEETQKPSLMDEVRDSSRKVESVAKTSVDQLIAQSRETVERINRVKEALGNPNLEIKDSFQNLLKNKLTHIDENLRIALSKAGVEFTAEDKTQPKGLVNPIENYLGMLTQSQDQLLHLGDHLNAMADRKELSPASMLAIQIKVGYIQQELEFFTSLLNKALESTKTLMNVQV